MSAAPARMHRFRRRCHRRWRVSWLRPQVVIAGVMQKIAGGRLVDEDTIQFCLAAIDDLLGEIRLLSLQKA